MALMNYKLAIVYTSITGNTREVSNIIYQAAKQYFNNVCMYDVNDFPIRSVSEFDAVIIGTYTWGNGEIPKEMLVVYKAFEAILHKKSIVTGVFGTGDSFYPHFCGAVDVFRDMLYVHTNLAATLKIELLPQVCDITKCNQLVELIVNRLIITKKINY